ncbi:TPM domain-containing protein [Arenibacter sp. GZD96]|uniref:TPM domain-containing protein n=1 Tax=Aurantibrevibacter litoralis TaxID=3106030 RepID=UPI002AFF14AA|nr:TPM domain-containing protein [Arenibacter sp. GZD-96]MEA1785801.1 TPM domain-containing protein [Arenibacter sp. GZD-96]
MSKVEDFLTASEENDIVKAICEAEKKTSGEIRVHLESFTDKPPLARAKELFHTLKMDNTKDGTGVLFYVAVTNKSYAIVGDHGIHSKVPKDFWESIKAQMHVHFSKGKFSLGIIEGIRMAGEKLQAHFPWQKGDENELTNELSKG